MTIVFLSATKSEATGLGAVLAWIAIGVGLLAVYGGLAYLIGRDANRRGRNGLAWGLLFLWQPVIVGIVYLFARRNRPTPGA